MPHRIHVLRNWFALANVAAFVVCATAVAGPPVVPNGKQLGSIDNADNVSTFLWQSSGEDTSVEEYKAVVASMLRARPRVLAVRVGNPDPVAFRTEVGTPFEKYFSKVNGAAHWKIITKCLLRLGELGTDPLALTAETCRQHNVLLVASFRMNDNHLGQREYKTTDFGLQNPQWRIPGTGLMDPAVPEVFQHRMRLFREVVENYDIDGIEFDFMRWHHMISEPHKNHPILTKMVAETRQMLDEVARREGRNELLLGVRVPPSLETNPNTAKYPGMSHVFANHCCRDKGLYVKTWIEQGYVDYVCPSLFWPDWPGLPYTKEFVEVAKGTDVGIYPTLFPLADWVHGPDSTPIQYDNHELLLRYKNEFCRLALQLYEDGADGISTYNWASTQQPGVVPHERGGVREGPGARQVQWIMHSKIADPDALRQYQAEQSLEGILGRQAAAADTVSKTNFDSIEIRHAKTIEGPIPCERIALGKRGDYKPVIVKLPDGELLVVAFDPTQRVGDKIREDMLLWRSQDGGRTWTDRKVIPPFGREPYFSVISDGTLFISVHFLKGDVRNKEGYTYSMLHRSTDRGETWETTEIGWQDVPGAAEKETVITNRNVLELHDGTLVFGVGAGHGNEYLWRSTDKGKTWDKTLRCKYHGFDQSTVKQMQYAILAEAFYWQARSGDLLAVCRVSPKHFPPIAGTQIPEEKTDHFQRMVLYRSKNGGRNWTLEELGSYYGEMYPAVLRLRDSRMLFTFTLREAISPQQPPLGVRAVLGRETEDGYQFDFGHDRIMIDTKSVVGRMSGGGFGPTVQLDDGTLVTSYSYAGPGGWKEDDFHIEVVRWRLPEERNR